MIAVALISNVGPVSADQRHIAELKSLTISLSRVQLWGTLESIGLDQIGSLAPPADPHVAGWYVGGPKPSSVGETVIVGAVDFKGETGVFWELRQVIVGDLIVLRSKSDSVHSINTFVVTEVTLYRKSDFPTARLYANLSYQGVALVTGGGPLLDMGPYYLSALVTLLGPVASVTAMTSRTRDTRMIALGDRAGEVIPVTIDSHVTALLRHESGAVSTLIVTFDAVGSRSANIEVHGETGTLAVPDPNHFMGEVNLLSLGQTEWKTLEVSGGYLDGGRGIGLVDLARTPVGKEPRAGGLLAFHVLDVMESVLRSAEQGVTIEVVSTVARPDPVPLTTLERR